ncbi:phage tail protein [Thalassomonas viridans]|uniref:Phage tail protein n=1 Tax=Thalassomonas viridans TaxID=137584 RepID=A0AAE9Z3A4_9GAMM|nr:tail fiber protein [Thalassomonas viridans]WDE05961.1 phage tail protein [Thalassomonas viridans]
MSEPFIGEIRMFAGNFAPKNWAFCDGQLLAISSNEALFSLLGTNYGGDGRSSFGLPEMRGRLPMHMGQGAGLSNRNLGSRPGVERVTLTSDQMPAHSHALVASLGEADASDPAGRVIASQTDGDMPYAVTPGVPTSIQDMDSRSLSSAGDSLPHNNMMPYLGVNFIISLLGVYPSRN